MKDNNFNGFDDDFDFDAEEYRKAYNDSKRRANHKGIVPKFTSKGNRGKNSSKRKKSFWPLFWKIALSCFLVCVITGCIVVGAVMVYAFNFVDAEMADDLDNLTMDFTTTVYAKDEQSGEWVEYQRLHGTENRIWVPLEKIPENLQNAYIAIEDKRFRDHNGVDWKRTFSAFANLFLHFYDTNQGGSTITQQLVKNLTGDTEKDAMRKIREIMRARYLEENYDKDTILECYLNVVNLAGGMNGVQVAANYYFDKDVSELSLTECAAIAGMVKSPTKYRPDKNPENNRKRRNTVLYEMYSQGYISKEDYETAKNEELVVVASKENTKETSINSYFIDALIDEVTADLAATYNYDSTYASKNFYNGGYRIYCTLIPSLQETMEKYFNDESYFKETQEYKGQKLTVQASMTVVDYEGHIVGLVGGAGEKTVNRGLNRATQGYNQPGSTVKPLTAYSQAIEKNVITYSTILDDNTERTHNDKPWPRNWYGRYDGPTFAFKALERSINTIPVNLIDQMGMRNSFNFLKTVGYTNFDEQGDLNLSSLALGGSSKGITTKQAAAAFAIFGNLGQYYEPTTYVSVTDQFGNKEILSHKNITPTVALSEDTACVMNHMLQNVVYGENGTGTGAKSFHRTMKMFAKTGTSSEANDCWFIGGTPYYVGACWYGYDYDLKVKNTSNARKLWTGIMTAVHKNLPEKVFPESKYVTTRLYCKETGLVATSKCVDVDIGYYKTRYMPTCTTHTGRTVDELSDDDVDSIINSTWSQYSDDYYNTTSTPGASSNPLYTTSTPYASSNPSSSRTSSGNTSSKGNSSRPSWWPFP